jgi:hypothetical protein
MDVTIPRLPEDESVWDDFPIVGKPGWIMSTEYGTGKVLKPLIRCNCGHITGIGLHHVHADGRVTASFYHKRGTIYPEDPHGCEWHVFLRLEGWSGGDIPPDQK